MTFLSLHRTSETIVVWTLLHYCIIAPLTVSPVHCCFHVFNISAYTAAGLDAYPCFKAALNKCILLHLNRAQCVACVKLCSGTQIPVLMHRFSLLQIIFRKIADVMREQEHQRSEVALSIPEDHPVRKLFQRFRQQRDSQTPGESLAYLGHNCVQVELQRHHHSDSNSYTQCQTVSLQHQQYSSIVQSNPPCTGGGEGAGKAATPQALVQTEKSEHSGTQEAVETVSRPCAEIKLCQVGNSPARGSGAGGEAGGVGGVTSSRGAKGWAKFKNATSAAPAPPAVEREKQTQKLEEWPKGLQSSEQLTAARISEEGGDTGTTEGGNSAGEAGEETSALHKTDSCDSGITKSDLRIDRAGVSRNSFERSPMEKSPMERNPFEHSLCVDGEVSLKHSFVQPASEQTLLQATLHEAKQELKGDIQILSVRLLALESQVSEILRLLSVKRRLSLPPTSSPKARVKAQDSVAASRAVTRKTDDGPFWIRRFKPHKLDLYVTLMHVLLDSGLPKKFLELKETYFAFSVFLSSSLLHWLFVCKSWCAVEQSQ